MGACLVVAIVFLLVLIVACFRFHFKNAGADYMVHENYYIDTLL